MSIKKFISKLMVLLNPEDTKYPMKIDNFDKMSISPGETKYVILIKNKNMSFVANAKKIKENTSLFNSLPPSDKEMVEADLNGELLNYISKTDEIN